MAKAYILVQVEPSRAGKVLDALLRLSGVLSAEGVTGPYDIVAAAEAPRFEGLHDDVIASIRQIEGILHVLPCVVTRQEQGRSTKEVSDADCSHHSRDRQAPGGGGNPCRGGG